MRGVGSLGTSTVVRALAMAAAGCLLAVPSGARAAGRQITINSVSGIRTLKARELRELRRQLEELEKTRFERAQTFGEHFERAKALCAEAEAKMNANPSDDEGAELAVAGCKGELNWLAENETRRSQFLVRRRQLGDLLIDVCERLGVSLSDPALQGVTVLMKSAGEEFERGEMRRALELFDQCDRTLDARIAEELRRLLEQVRGLMESKSWDKALELLSSARAVAPTDAELLKLLDEVRRHAVTTLRVSAWMDGKEVPALAHIDGEWEVMPLVRDVRKGEKVTLRVVTARGMESYGAATAYYSCDWFGEQSFKVELMPVEGPRARRPWKVTFAGGKAAEMEMSFIRPGNFEMGRERGEQSGDQRHPVELRHGYWLGRHEVTQGQWLALMEKNPSFRQGSPELPVENVSWEDAMLFCRKLTNQERLAGRLPEDYIYTLPSEAQWEYACRAGSTGPFSFGDDELVMTLYGNVSGTEDGYAALAPVGKFRPNAWGLHDMHGNVSEWCRDFYGTYVGGVKQVEPTGPEDAEALRVHRGGSWLGGLGAARSYARDFATPSFHDETIGFRVALVRVPRPTAASAK